MTVCERFSKNSNFLELPHEELHGGIGPGAATHRAYLPFIYDKICNNHIKTKEPQLRRQFSSNMGEVDG